MIRLKQLLLLVALVGSALFLMDVVTLPEPAAPIAPSHQVAPESPSTYRPELRKGMVGPRVRELQTRLNSLVWNVCFNHSDSDARTGKLCSTEYRIAVDGKFGPDTTQAVKMFQRQQLLAPDGIVGPKTWAKLLNPLSPCEAAYIALKRAGATEREANFGAWVAKRESYCHLEQVVYRPSTRDHSYGPFGINYYGSLRQRTTSSIGPSSLAIKSWVTAARQMLRLGREHGWCHWYKSPSQFYCAGPKNQRGMDPPIVARPA